MKKQYIISIAIISLILFSIISCEKDITVELPRPDEKLTIEGTIELNEYPIVFLSKNQAYFDAVDTTYVNDLLINEDVATVIVSYNGTHDTLTQQYVPRWPYYAFVGSKFQGQLNSSYELKVIYNGKEYTSTTNILDTVAIDSVGFDVLGDLDSIGFITVRWQDPASIGDYYSLYTKHVCVQEWFYRPFFSTHVSDDKLLNGDAFEFYPVTRGYERNDYYNDFDDPNDTTSSFLYQVAYKIGDTVTVKLAKIDENSYQFWNSWYRNMMTEGNPFTNPASVKTNIIGENVNGFWIGRASYNCTFYIVDSANVEILN
ncbi:MAG: hypothetical protein C0596_15885 [Marinilabiliales bacterium]|nr:MAG: hypothetical protein C0596_15885 [Marinilabiliales bacterium]